MRPPGRCFVVLACALLLSEAALAQETIVRGREYYLRYCAPCHGKDADGRGPIAPALKASPADLRHLGEHYGMPLPTATSRALSTAARALPPAHGSPRYARLGKAL